MQASYPKVGDEGNMACTLHLMVLFPWLGIRAVWHELVGTLHLLACTLQAR